MSQVGPNGQVADASSIDHLDRLKQEFYTIGDFAWCYVGNGLSNQTFVRGPAGLIAIDTGESIEEMQAALKALREHTDAPIVACIYSHFHYVNGTQAILDEGGLGHLNIYGHELIRHNLTRFGGEVAPRSGKGLVYQFGTALPEEGPDALLHCGLGRFYRNPEHAPFTPGYIPANHTISEQETTQIAGLTVEFTPAPSDATDSITIWFPDLKLVVNNLIWPALFNIYAIRGEEYRDPRILIKGMEHIVDRAPDHLIGTHGPPLSEGQVDLQKEVQNYRDSIQFLWDQTVRLINKGYTAQDASLAIQLPDSLSESYLTQQFYGIAEHHVRQIHAGLFGWFDGYEADLLPLQTEERHRKLIAGFGGREQVRKACDKAIAEDDHRWALELATWLARSPEAPQEDRQRLADILRTIAQTTSSANLRNWALTHALSLEEQIDLSRLSRHRFNQRQILNTPPARSIQTMSVVVDAEAAAGLDIRAVWHFSSGERVGLHVRNCIALVNSGNNADLQLGLSLETWAEILSGNLTLADALDTGVVSFLGDLAMLKKFCAVFEIPTLQLTQ